MIFKQFIFENTVTLRRIVTFEENYKSCIISNVQKDLFFFVCIVSKKGEGPLNKSAHPFTSVPPTTFEVTFSFLNYSGHRFLHLALQTFDKYFLNCLFFKS